jgi:hypothetical protein
MKGMGGYRAARSVLLAGLVAAGCSGQGPGTTPTDAGEAPGAGDGSWSPPIAIPAPPFGLADDPTAGCASRTARSQADLTGLASLAAGTVVEIAGGPHAASNLVLGGTGTAECPIVVRGPSAAAKAVIQGSASLVGSYVVFENLDFDLATAAEGISLSGDHLVLRRSDAHGYRPGRNSTVIFAQGSTDVVLYDLHVWDNGDFSYVGEQDVHGVGATTTHRMWIVDSRIHRNRGDAIQLGHQAANTLGDFYIGRNDLYDNGENSVDIKEASNVVVSQNELHDPPAGYPTVVLHDCPINAAVIYNTVHDAEVGVNTASLEDNCADDLPVSIFVLKNSFRTISDTAVQSWGSGKRYYVTGNAFTSVGTAVDVSPAEPGSILAEGDEGLADAFAAFTAIYGLDISTP